MHYRLDCYCKEHAEIIRTDEEVDHAYEAIYYLSHWLRIARGRANEFLEMQLSEALAETETRLQRVKQGLDQTRKRAGDPN